MNASARIKEVLKTGQMAKNPEIRAFIDEYQARREAETAAGYGLGDAPDRTAEAYSPGVAPGGVDLTILRLDDRFLADYTRVRVDGNYTQMLMIVEESFVDQVIDAAEGLNTGDAAKAYAWLPHFKRAFGIGLK